MEFEKISHQTLLEEITEKRKHEIEELNNELKDISAKNSENERKLKEADLNEESYRTKIRTLEDLLTKLQSGVTKLESSSEKQVILQQQIERLEQQLVEVCLNCHIIFILLRSYYGYTNKCVRNVYNNLQF